MVRCRKCGLIFYNPRPSPENIASLYSDDYFAQEFPAGLTEEQIRLAHRRLARIESKIGKGSLLDVGCGVGRFLAAASQRRWRATGLDASPAAVRAAALTSGAEVIEGDLKRPRPPGILPFDVVTLWDVLEHLADPVGDLGRLAQWLRPGGMLVVQTQNAGGVTYAWMRRRWEQFVDYHLYHFSARTLRMALERAGFQAIRIEASEQFLHDDPAPTPPGQPRTAAGTGGLLERARRARDLILIAAGYDAFNLMVATARLPGEGDA
ncbi:MAG: class I SAM-dependent methyltransferase [Candidatus Rokubacteria bacterium]|nr:class I SAM-dependent methyltransferase [Candidatus Rokubacteria bacterium]